MSDNAGLVIVNYGAESIVEAQDGSLWRCTSRRKSAQPVCGDHVLWRSTGVSEGVIESVDMRRNQIARTNFRGQSRPIAANVDRMIVVSAVEPAPDPDLIDRYLVLGEHLNVQTHLAVNKVDLADERTLAAIDRDLAPYRALGYPVRHVSARIGLGMDVFREDLAEHTSILVGLSGVGKSSMLNALVPDLELRTSTLSHASRQGRHTTTATTLYRLQGAGALIDSPGIRTLRLGPLSFTEIERGFIEFRPHLGHCRFRDCRHGEEPECAIKEAVQAGHINPRRFESFHRLTEGLAV